MPQYAVKPTPTPEESAAAIQIERTISAAQAKEFEQQGARRIGREETLRGFAVQSVVDRLSQVTERPSLHYRAYLYGSNDPNAAALADGRIYLSTGLINYLASRGGRADEPFDSSRPPGVTRSGRMPSEVEAELAFVLGHELAHTVAQHLVKRYRTLQQQQLLMTIVAAGASAVTRNAGPSAQQAGQLALDATSLLQDVANSGYSQEQELEADQLGIRYLIRAGFRPRAALDVLQDFERFDNPWPFLRTHPYAALRRQYLERYLNDENHPGAAPAVPEPPRVSERPPTRHGASQRIRDLRDAQKLYPVGSVSWQNLQRQIDALEVHR